MLFVLGSFMCLDLPSVFFVRPSLFCCLCVDPFSSFLLRLCFVCLSLFQRLCVDLFSCLFFIMRGPVLLIPTADLCFVCLFFF